MMIEGLSGRKGLYSQFGAVLETFDPVLHLN